MTWSASSAVPGTTSPGPRTSGPPGSGRRSASALTCTTRSGRWFRLLTGFYIPYSEQNAIMVLEKAENRALREEMYRLTIARAAETNGPVVAEILALRQEVAELLGYARTYTGDEALELTAADVDNPLDGFYATKLRESLGLASAASVSVPVETARQVMMDALAELYGVTFTRSDAPGWHPDVEAFDLRDASGRHLARIFCDWSLRDSKRPFGGWMSGPYLATDGGPHVITVVTNVPPAGADLQQLRIMWHEFGHALHFAFTRTRYRQRSPDDGPRDFIEGPSRIMENWPLEPEILRPMGVPAETAQAARAEDLFRTASRRMTRLVRPAIDLALHRGEDALPVKQRHLPVPVDPADATAAHFHHIFAGEYGASHYAYQWAGVMDADLFTRFAAEGPATGRDYAERVLAPGAERDPADLIRDFLGRDVTVRALLVRDGVADI
jgi:Zn-dependent oligopeptidase